MTSLRRLKANRANAKRSTGPRSLEGKQIAAGNAMKFGLSVPLGLDEASPWAREIIDLLHAETGSQDGSRTIARCILELERTLAAQYAVAHQAVAVDQAGTFEDEEGHALREEIEQAEFIRWTAKGYAKRFKKTKGAKSIEVEEMRLHEQAGAFLGQAAVTRARGLRRDAQNQAKALRRYFKRASNQLCKAIVAL